MPTKYLQIYQDLKNEIEQMKYPSGKKLPDEHSLCARYGCSRMTVRKAYDLLVAQGLVYRKQGLGTFARNFPSGNIHQADIFQGLSDRFAGRITTEVLEFSLIFADRMIAESLQIRTGDPAYDIIRLRKLDDSPYVLEHLYLSPALVPGITRQILCSSLYQYIERDLKLPIYSAASVIRADRSSTHDQEYLQISSDDPVLEITQTAFLQNGIPFELSINRYHPYRSHTSVRMKKS